MTNPATQRLSAGLYLVATPIGNARDITLRALDILAAADVLAAEDTRSLRRLAQLHGIDLSGRALLAYHEHNGAKMRPRLLAEIAAGRSVAYMSEAGTPTISDPGFDLARAARAEGLAVTTAPGASAVVAALTIAGLPTDRFFFAGFLPNAAKARRRALEEVAAIPGTLVFYESPRRLGAMLADAAAVLGGAREAAVCREITKKFEELRGGTLDELAAHYADAPAKGEIVVLVGRGTPKEAGEAEIEDMLRDALATMSVRDAADSVSGALGVKRRQVYQAAMRLSAEGDAPDPEQDA
ncbi:16S rRNA (cytidine(1402)-2'-O)-methyltransferase [Citreimonas salinaria]|uniref:Ribosomal RNA small subunit methyltransferase I n=1 Tax=Citreimonas salinaria TaxID=321339 RepID=A0A1H3I449_9RHOB|nr:16S rRNA (cytidine(1402)-2'-O)-methyltransferase [Citreimonas salinaria]SDY21898.1 16S rRNA (cytidine1402-2'-O)-methyltransferase [Citreimonas salinaria]